MSAEADPDVCFNAVGKSDEEKSGTQAPQLSPFHTITIPHSTAIGDQLPQIDSPRAVAPKIKKSTMTYNSTSVADNHPVPGRKGRRAKNCGKKKTSETTASSKVEADNNADKVHDKTSNGTNKSPGGDNKETVSGKSGLDGRMVEGADTGKSESSAKDSELLVPDKTLNQYDAASDVEKNEPARDMVKDRRCTSVPAGRSRKSSSRREREASHKITEYFPIRRSSRMTTTELKKQELSDMQESIRSNKHDGLKVVDIPCKGRGVVATRPFTKGEFVVEYAGDLVELGVAKQREMNYSTNQHVGCYMYYFQHRNKNYCVDATGESGLLGRLVNHSRLKFNCATKVVEVDSVPRLILVAARDVAVDEELLYDYGDRNKESLEAYPWLAT